MVTTTLGESRSKIDARPVRPTSNRTPWDRALSLRDQIASAVRSTLDKEALEAAVFVSANGQYPPWIKLEAWLPGAEEPECRERTELTFTIDTKPYYEHDTVISAQLSCGKIQIAVKERPDFQDHHVAEWVAYALRRGPKPSNYTPGLDALGHFFTSLLPFLSSPHENRLRPEYRTRFTGAMALGLLSIVVLIAGASQVADERGAGLLMILAAIAGLVGVALIVRFRKRAVSVTPQSGLTPRNLGLVDSWHAVVAELGRDFAKVRGRLVNAITDDVPFGATSQIETYTHRAPNGYEQRERLVITKDQGMVHVHIYQFGHDVFVGWHAYLNWAQWGEIGPVSTKIRKNRRSNSAIFDPPSIFRANLTSST